MAFCIHSLVIVTRIYLTLISSLIITDINECLLDVCDDSAIRCEDEVPGFSCICRVGAQGDGKINGTKCTDVNECKYQRLSNDYK